MRDGSSPAPSARLAHRLVVGLDIGSITVKAVVEDAAAGRPLWTCYRRHETQSWQTALDLLARVEAEFPGVPSGSIRVFATGQGALGIAEVIGAGFVQEVNALCLAVECRHLEVRSVVELGGEDAKIITFRSDPRTGARSRTASMNDKCAGGTGVILDRIGAKLGIPADHVNSMRYRGMPIHPIASKCGVFAETDITGLQRQGVEAPELMASLFDAIVRQNLAVLARGTTLLPPVWLLGGPHAFIPGLAECWRHHLPRMWRERDIDVPSGASLEELIQVPEDALFFAALGAEYGRSVLEKEPGAGLYLGHERLRERFENSRAHLVRGETAGTRGQLALAGNAEELRAFKQAYDVNGAELAPHPSNTTREGFLGLDGGSTSTKAVLLNLDGKVIAKAYRLSQGNPIEDARAVMADLESQIAVNGEPLRILGAGTTGYAKDVLKEVIGADLALAETIAHMRSALEVCPRAEIVCDVGGQDIKILVLRGGAVRDFRINAQCSAGTGYYLQSTAAAFGVRVEDYADLAFQAAVMPEFSPGCAVFLQSEIVDFQRQGWQPSEILAGLAAVLPKNIWRQIFQVPHLPRLGGTFMLQGGVQRNLAALKAQVDYIRAQFSGAGIEPEIRVHPHCGEAGAIGCALEARRRYAEQPYRTSFVGLKVLRAIRCTALRDETTRCSQCPNRCMRTFIEIETGFGKREGAESAADLNRRIIVANCEAGVAQDPAEARAAAKQARAIREANPNLVEIAARTAFAPVAVEAVSRRARKSSLWRLRGVQRERVRVGMPRVLNMYSLGPFFMGWFQSLGVPAENLVWSEFTSERLIRDGSTRGSIDPCFPTKSALAHVHDLVHRTHTPGAPLTHIFFPIVDALPTWLEAVQDSRTCPASAAAPEAVHAAFIKESDVFAQRNTRFKRTLLDLRTPERCARQLFEDWRQDLGLDKAETMRATAEAFKALERYHAELRAQARDVLDRVVRENRIALVMLARPYHNDPGMNHAVCAEFQKRGYPILTCDSLPIDDAALGALFGTANEGRSIGGVWKNSYSEHGSRKIWAAQYAARHPHLVAIELSSFKCGLDAAIAATLEAVIESAGIPFFAFRDLDENRPAASLMLRIETIAHFLGEYQERMIEAVRHE